MTLILSREYYGKFWRQPFKNNLFTYSNYQKLWYLDFPSCSSIHMLMPTYSLVGLQYWVNLVCCMTICEILDRQKEALIDKLRVLSLYFDSIISFHYGRMFPREVVATTKIYKPRSKPFFEKIQSSIHYAFFILAWPDWTLVRFIWRTKLYLLANLWIIKNCITLYFLKW